jgi:phosphoglycerate dehydrogenase-like enzyme
VTGAEVRRADATHAAEDPLVVGVLYPQWFHSDERAFGEELERLGAVDPRVRVVVGEYQDDSQRRTRRSSPAFLRAAGDHDELRPEQLAVLAEVDVALTLDLPLDLAAVAPRLRWVQAVGSGIGQLRSSGLAEHGIRLSNAAGTSSPEIAEFVLARILEHWKRLPELGSLQDERRWSPRSGRRLAGCTLGLVGLGPINLEVARLCGALGMRVLATRRTPGQVPGLAAVYPPNLLLDMVGECDAVVAALPETTETIGLFDAEAFAAMPAGAFFCNVGRGSAVVDAALLDALRSGHLSGAALDVFNAEPLPVDDPYWTAPGSHVSAHCASVPDESIRRVHELFRENVRRYLAGEPLRNEVDLALGY